MKLDYLVVGAGIVGLSTAFHLKRAEPAARVRVLEGRPRIASGASGRSAALYRDLFASATSRALASSSISYYESIAAEISLVPRGYLWCLDRAGRERAEGLLPELVAGARGLRLVEPGELGERLAPGALPGAAGALFAPRAGSLSAMALAERYARDFLAMGGEILTGRRAAPPEPAAPADAPWEAASFRGLRDQGGELHEARVIVAAAGAWSQDLLGPVGLASSVYAKKRQLFAIRLPRSAASPLYAEGLPPERAPVLILPGNGVYLKPVVERGIVVAGRADGLGRPFLQPCPESGEAEDAYFRGAIEPALRAAFPAWAAAEPGPLPLASAWAGFYDYHEPDRNPVLESFANLVLVAGSSGSGIMKGDAIGRLAAALARGDAEAELADGRRFPCAALSLGARSVEAEGLVI